MLEADEAHPSASSVLAEDSVRGELEAGAAPFVLLGQGCCAAVRQYLYPCTSKASKLSTSGAGRKWRLLSPSAIRPCTHTHTHTHTHIITRERAHVYIHTYIHKYIIYIYIYIYIYKCRLLSISAMRPCKKIWIQVY